MICIARNKLQDGGLDWLNTCDLKASGGAFEGTTQHDLSTLIFL